MTAPFPSLTAEMLAVLRAAHGMDLWQEEDERTTNEYAHEHFGFSEVIREVTAQADAAAEAGLVELHVGAYGARRWEPTTMGLRMLARAEQESQR